MQEKEVAKVVKARLIKGCENAGGVSGGIYTALVLAVSRWQKGANIFRELEELKLRFPARRDVGLIERCAREIASLLEQ